MAERVIIDGEKTFAPFGAPQLFRRRLEAVAADVSTAALVPAGAAFRKAAIRSASVERVDGRRFGVRLRDSFFPEDSRLRRSAGLVAFSFVRFARLI